MGTRPHGTIHRTLLAATALLALTGAGFDAPGAEVSEIELLDVPAEIEPMITWALDLFDEADLELPPVRFEYHGDDTRPCRGRSGIHQVVEGTSVIGICSSETGSVRELVVLHELSHAWVDHHLEPDTKAEFQELRGWTHWRNYEKARWHENGTEQAAEIMVWGLVDRPLNMIRIHDNSCDDLEAGYLVLTGRPPLHGFRDACPGG